MLNNSPQKFIWRVWKKSNTKNLGWSSQFPGRNLNPKYMGHSCPADRDVLFAARRKRAWHTHTAFILIKTTVFLRRTVRQNQHSNNFIESGPRSIHMKCYSKSSNFDQSCIWSKYINLQYQISPSPDIENTLRKHTDENIQTQNSYHLFTFKPFPPTASPLKKVPNRCYLYYV